MAPANNHVHLFNILEKIKAGTGTPNTVGLSAKQLEQHLDSPDLKSAIISAEVVFDELESELKMLLKSPEGDVIKTVQSQILNFYPLDCCSPYIPLVAKGPWIVTCYGSVLYETGGYGMVGFGHNPDFLNEKLRGDQVMANVRTPSLAQIRLIETLQETIGHTREGGCPFSQFIFMNSGSEAMLVATRISDVHALEQTNIDAPSNKRAIKFLSLEGGFHGRTCRPARASDSTRAKYKILASFKDDDVLWTIPPNDIQALRDKFKQAESEGVFIEAMLIEPVMGEGNPGMAIDPEFYLEARQLTIKHNTFLIVDSIQAGLRATGELSIVDYPGFEGLPEPDMETYSKAINAGQYPLSILSLNARATKAFRQGIYGNTMTANPRALDIARAVLNSASTSVRENIRARGKEFLEKLALLKNRYPKLITNVQGTGLLLSMEFIPEVKVFGENSLEEIMRIKGINQIHGGVNSLRFTPTFSITSEEIDLILEVTEQALCSLQGR